VVRGIRDQTVRVWLETVRGRVSSSSGWMVRDGDVVVESLGIVSYSYPVSSSSGWGRMSC
jgi:hypothetical protein